MQVGSGTVGHHHPTGKKHHHPSAAHPGSAIRTVSNGEWDELHPASIRRKMRNQVRLGDSEVLSDKYWLLGVKMGPGRQEMLL